MKKTQKLISTLMISFFVFGLFRFTSIVEAQSPQTEQVARISPVAMVNNPVIWKTNYAKFSASDFYIKIGDKYFYSTEPVKLNSNPGTKYTTLELIWTENGVEMHMNMYFNMIDDKTWELTELRTYNGKLSGDWIFYPKLDVNNNPVTGMAGYTMKSDTITFIDPNTGAEFYCRDCSFEIFPKPNIQYSEQGYGLELFTGIASNETITLSTNPNYEYGIGVLLRNSQGQAVTDQSQMTYEWKSMNEEIAKVYAEAIDYGEGTCAYGIKPPCPPTRGGLKGINPGITKVQVSVRKSGYIIATTDFDVKVTNKYELYPSGVPISTPTPSPQVTSNPNGMPIADDILMPSPIPVDDDSLSEEQLEQEIEKLKGTIGEMQVKVDNQQKELNVLQRMVKNLTNWFRKFFRINN